MHERPLSNPRKVPFVEDPQSWLNLHFTTLRASPLVPMAGKGELSDSSVDDLSALDLFDAERGGGAALKPKQKPGRGAPRNKRTGKNSAYTTGEKEAAEKKWMARHARPGWTFKNLAEWFVDKYKKPLKRDTWNTWHAPKRAKVISDRVQDGGEGSLRKRAGIADQLGVVLYKWFEHRGIDREA